MKCCCRWEYATGSAEAEHDHIRRQRSSIFLQQKKRSQSGFILYSPSRTISIFFLMHRMQQTFFEQIMHGDKVPNKEMTQRLVFPFGEHPAIIGQRFLAYIDQLRDECGLLESHFEVRVAWRSTTLREPYPLFETNSDGQHLTDFQKASRRRRQVKLCLKNETAAMRKRFPNLDSFVVDDQCVLNDHTCTLFEFQFRIFVLQERW